MWFSGGINEAINKSKKERKLFVVYINGSDEISRKMDDLYDSLSTKLSELPLVAIRLESQSDNCKLFSQIYPVIVIPITFFIDLNGVAIEIIGGSVENQNVLMEKINKTIDSFKKSLISNQSETPEQNPNIQTTHNSENREMTANASTSDTSDTQSIPSNGSESGTQNWSEATGIDDKVERANRLIEAIRQKKAKEEADKEKADEIERRKGMKEMQKSKRLREDKETMEAISEREREKREERLAREKVLAQIAADKEERKKRQALFSGNQNTEQLTPKQNKIEETEVRQRVSDKTRIQFRLPDGSTANHIFKSNDRLESVRQYVSSNFNIRSFVLSMTFPRREFLSEDYPKTLEELTLCPSSVLLVISKTKANISGAVTSPSIFWQIVTYLSLPFVMIWNLVTSFFNRQNSNQSEGTTQPLNQQKNPKKFYKSDGNITQMKDMNEKDDNDDNNTYNGNSTQQM